MGDKVSMGVWSVVLVCLASSGDRIFRSLWISFGKAITMDGLLKFLQSRIYSRPFSVFAAEKSSKMFDDTVEDISRDRKLDFSHHESFFHRCSTSEKGTSSGIRTTGEVFRAKYAFPLRSRDRVHVDFLCRFPPYSLYFMLNTSTNFSAFWSVERKKSSRVHDPGRRFYTFEKRKLI